MILYPDKEKYYWLKRNKPLKNIAYMQCFYYICKDIKWLTSGAQGYLHPGVRIVQTRV